MAQGESYLLRKRFAFIETAVRWGGGITAAMLARAFGIARQNAQRLIQQYQRRHPGNLRYDPKRRRKVASDHFQPHYIRDRADLFLDYLRGLNLVAHFEEEPDPTELWLEDVDRLVRPRLRDGAVRQVVAALRERQAIEVLYHSRYTTTWRRLSPHALVYADGRYHLRAYCHLLKRYGDFVLSRIEEAARPSAEAWVSDEGDLAWHTRVDAIFQINPELPAETKEMLRWSYAVDKEDRLAIPQVRLALLPYLAERRLTKRDPILGKPLWIQIAPSELPEQETTISDLEPPPYLPSFTASKTQE